MKLVIRALQAPIHLYRLTLSPFLGQNCRFAPTCSAYALEALELHGPLRGSWLALRRLLRCHPVTWLGGSSGFDPVPPAAALRNARSCVTHAHSHKAGGSCHNLPSLSSNSDPSPKAPL